MYVGFVLTGLGTTLLGCALPTLIANWHLNDARAGGLFAAQFAGSALGAALVTHDFFHSIIRGYVLLAVGALSLACFNGSPRSWLFLIFGLGLGLTMTATSMLTSALFPANRGAALSLLNACWGLGAVLCPGLVSFWVFRWGIATLYLAFGLVSAVVLLFAKRLPPAMSPNSTIGSGMAGGRSPLRLITAFALVGFLYVGVEASVSGWMMAYVRRLTSAHDLWAPVAVSCFWIALLGGRAVAPALLRRISEEQLLSISLGCAFVGVLLLIGDRSGLTIILSATISGLVLGPIYPLCLAKILALANDSPRTKWIFGACGFGGALLPWLTGKISAYKGSLSVGLVVPLGALAVMILLQFAASQKSPQPVAENLAIR
jgi:fucose permease